MNETPFTNFIDIHSGGTLKQPPYDNIYIQAPKEKAIEIFKNYFGHDPDAVACEWQ